MSNSHHHGMRNQAALQKMCTLNSFEHENIGRFGRMFRNLSPLYSLPNSLIELGKKGGIMDGGTQQTFTNTVPLGMIFFGQFIDHDITLDTTSKFNLINVPENIDNFRTPALDLDCIFGEGPEDEPFLYEKDTKKLLTGISNNNIGQGSALEKHDLPRTGQGIAIIGDPRNDENRIISQLQLAFIRFYNAVYTDIVTENTKLYPSQVYEAARKMVTWHYQWIVVNEFLPAMVGQETVTQILGKGRQYYRPSSKPFIPVEFSIAAYRFGHSMIAQELRLQTDGALRSIFSPQVGRGFSRISSSNQIVDWSLFFDLNGMFQKAGKLNTQLASDLLALPFFPPNTPDHEKSLAIRNLLRGQSFLMPSGESVAQHLGRNEAEIAQVNNFVKNQIAGQAIDLTAGTPLWYYILAEAEVIGRGESGLLGEGLGPVGGMIVAETIIGLLELDPNSYLGNDRSWSPTLGNNGHFTMADLLTKAAEVVMT